MSMGGGSPYIGNITGVPNIGFPKANGLSIQKLHAESFVRWTRCDVFMCVNSFLKNAKKPALFPTYDFIPIKTEKKKYMRTHEKFFGFFFRNETMRVSWDFS